MNGKLWVQKKFSTHICARDDLVKVSRKSDARKCQNQVTSPYFDQPSERCQTLPIETHVFTLLTYAGTYGSSCMRQFLLSCSCSRKMALNSLWFSYLIFHASHFFSEEKNSDRGLQVANYFNDICFL